MLENEIKKLTAAVEALTAAIQAQGVTTTEAPKPSAPEPMPAITLQDIEQESPEPTVEHDAAPPSRDDLRELCLAIVREDRSKKASVAGAIEKFGGKLLKDVPDDKLAELKVALEALK